MVKKGHLRQFYLSQKLENILASKIYRQKREWDQFQGDYTVIQVHVYCGLCIMMCITASGNIKLQS